MVCLVVVAQVEVFLSTSHRTAMEVPAATAILFLNTATWRKNCASVALNKKEDSAMSIVDGSVIWQKDFLMGLRKLPLVIGYNHKETYTSSGTFTAPQTGLYRITLQGGGGGGGGAGLSSNGYRGGGSGGGIEACKNREGIPPMVIAMYTQGRGYAFVGGGNK
jgi:hypothetical protein